MIGKQISHYRILEKLGEGGMGVVYKAEDTKLGRTVALKFLPPGAVVSEDDRERFVGEARAAAVLDHPNICTVYEIGEADGQLYIAMAHVEGESLRERIDRTGPIGVLEALRLARQVAEGLAAAHEKGIVHRDIKSANIIVTPKGTAKIMDFGLAYHVEGGTLTSDGSTLGTVAYGAPEQARGEEADYRADIWSLGVTLYEMVTGQLPFRGDYGSAVIYSVLNEEPDGIEASMQNAPDGLSAIIARALQKDPARRFQSAQEFADELQELRVAIDPQMSRAGMATGRYATVEHGSWLHQLTGRNALLALLGYIVATVIITKGVDVIVARLMLSPYLVNTVRIGMLSLIPTVLIIATHRKLRASSSRVATVGIPINLVASVLLLFGLFSGKNLGAATTTVEITNEEGQTVERAVPKVEFRKKVALFILENKTGHEALDWMQYGIPVALELDLFQDAFVVTRSSVDPSAFRRLRDKGFDSWVGVPLSLQKKIAEEYNMDTFLAGTIDNDEQSGWKVTARLYQTRSTKVLSEIVLNGADVFTLVDELSVRVRMALGVPDWHIEEGQHLPTAEVLTNSVEAFKEYSLSQKASAFDRDTNAEIEHLERAVAADSTFALAHYDLFLAYKVNNEREKSRAAIESALQYEFKVPELFRFIFKANNYFDLQEPEKAFSVIEIMGELYPSDPLANQALAQVHTIRDEVPEAIEAYKKLLESDPYELRFVRRISDLYVRQGEFESALQYQKEFVRLNATNSAAFVSIGELYQTMGQFENARTSFEKALLLEPDRIQSMTAISNAEFNLGNFAMALQHLEEALPRCKSPESRIAVLQGFQDYYKNRGQISKGLEYVRMRYKESEAILPEIRAAMSRINDMDMYPSIGRLDIALDEARRLEKILTGSQFEKAIPMAYLVAYMSAKMPDEADKALDGFAEYIDAFKLEMVRAEYFAVEGNIAIMREKYDEAIASFNSALALRPEYLEGQFGMGKALRLKGEYKASEEYLLQAGKKSPFDGNTCYELALLYHAMDDQRTARHYLERALTVWADADKEFKPAVEARATQAEWASTSNL